MEALRRRARAESLRPLEAESKTEHSTLSVPVESSKATAFLETVASNVKVARYKKGLGYELEIEAPELAGMGVWHNGKMLHLAAFRLEEEPAKWDREF